MKRSTVAYAETVQNMQIWLMLEYRTTCGKAWDDMNIHELYYFYCAISELIKAKISNK